MSPWRRNPPMSLGDARVIEQLPSVSWLALDEGGQADVSFGSKTQHSVRVYGRSAAWPNVAGGGGAPGGPVPQVGEGAAAPGGGGNPKQETGRGRGGERGEMWGVA